MSFHFHVVFWAVWTKIGAFFVSLMCGCPERPWSHAEQLGQADSMDSKWQLKFHQEKCCIFLKPGHKRETQFFINNQNKEGNSVRLKLKETQAERNLGVTIKRCSISSNKWHRQLQRQSTLLESSVINLTQLIFVQATPGVSSLCMEARWEELESFLLWGLDNV